MFKLPRISPSLPWYQQNNVKAWLGHLFALTSRKSTYTLQLGGSQGLAWVNPQQRRIFVSTKLPEIKEQGLLRFDPLAPRPRLEMLLKGLVIHEAAHVRHSLEKPAGQIGQIWNCIEDERIERLMAAEYPELLPVFAFLGDVVTEAQSEHWDYSIKEGLLAWRFEHDRVDPRWKPQAQSCTLWNEEILPRLEAGWAAPDSEVVTELATEIYELLTENEDSAQTTPETSPDMEQESEHATEQVRGHSSTTQSPAPEQEPHIWNILGASGANADQLEPATDESNDSNGGDEPMNTTLPNMPLLASEPAIIAPEIEGYARRLAPLLRPLEKRGQVRPHRHKGRYDVRRDLRGDERVFLYKTIPTKPVPLTIQLLLDTSSSMRGEPLEATKTAAHMLIRAAALAQSKAYVHCFHSTHEPLITKPMSYLEAAELISRLKARGGTLLAPLLNTVTIQPIAPHEAEMIAVVCDGELSQEDYAQCALIVQKGRKAGKKYLPLLIDQALSYTEEWKQVFGSAVACDNHTDIAKHLKASLTALRHHLE